MTDHICHIPTTEVIKSYSTFKLRPTHCFPSYLRLPPFSFTP
ncbi:hypothetical protein LINPERHAP1_LOCUS18699 [Linum perenne]